MARMSKEQGREHLRAIVEGYAPLAATREAKHSTYTEAAARIDLIDHLLRALGWDLDNEDGLIESEREVAVERSGADGLALGGRPDYTLRVDGRTKLFCEAKRPSVDLLAEPRPAFQVRTYGWTSRLPVSVVTNFRQLVVYDTRFQPHGDDLPDRARRPGGVFELDELVARFDELWALLSRETIASERYDELFGTASLRGDEQFDERFLAAVRRWRVQLAAISYRDAPHATPRAINRRVQRVLNKLLFLRICEARGLEDYEQLLRLDSDAALDRVLERADRRYNAGLFKTVREDRWHLDELRPVIEDLYYPNSPFAFGVVSSEVLAAVYEQFLGEEVAIADGEVRIAEKPEVTHSGGIVPTPPPIVDALLDRALGDEEQRIATTGEVGDFTLCDPACGSGVFLIAAYRRLVAALERAGGGVPSLARKHRLQLTAIHGVDIDSEAVEVAKFGLLLALLEGEDATRIAQAPTPLLPNLDDNLCHGNSLIDFGFDRVFPGRLDDPDVLDEVAPFDWQGFGPRGRFDAVVGNPPYVRIQMLARYAPLQLAYFQHEESGYATAQAFNTDKYLLFLERALQLLGPDGRVAFVVPNRLLTALPATSLRQRLAEGGHVEEIVDFGVNQLFPGRTTYVCLLTLTQRANAWVRVEQVADYGAWRAGVAGSVRRRAHRDLDGAPWELTVGDGAAAVLSGLRRRFPRTLDDVAEIFVGVQTSADDVYFLEGAVVDGDVVRFSDADGRVREIEAGITRPALKKRRLRPYLSEPTPDAVAIFPYELQRRGGRRPRAVPLAPDEIETRFPQAWQYLCAHRQRLGARSVSPADASTWYRYGRSQSLTKLDEDKIIVRVMAREPQYCFDSRGLLVPGGGDGGPYYLIRPRDQAVDSHYLIALLSHPVVERMVVAGGKGFRGGYYVHRKAFLRDIPVPETPAMAGIAEATRRLSAIVAAFADETDERRRIGLGRLRDARRQEVEAMVADVLGLTAAELASVV